MGWVIVLGVLFSTGEIEIFPSWLPRFQQGVRTQTILTPLWEWKAGPYCN